MTLPIKHLTLVYIASPPSMKARRPSTLRRNLNALKAWLTGKR